MFKTPNTHRVRRTSIIRHLPCQRLKKRRLVRLLHHQKRAQPLLQVLVVPEHQAERLLAVFRIPDIYYPLDRVQRHKLDVFVRFDGCLLMKAVRTDGVRALQGERLRPLLAHLQLVGEEEEDEGAALAGEAVRRGQLGDFGSGYEVSVGRYDVRLKL